MKSLYAGLCVLGVVLPGWQVVPWLAVHGLDLPRLLSELFSNRISAFFGLDVIVSALVVAAFAWSERQKGHLHIAWPVVLATLGVGVSFGLPLLLFLRERSGPSATERTRLQPSSTPLPRS